MKCPGCDYERKKSDNAPDWQCPSCKIAYNKHPKYKKSNEYELQLTYKLIPLDEEIKTDIIYLYLNNKNFLEYVLIDENGEIKRVRLFDSELNGHAPAIVSVLKNSGTSLEKEQEQVLFSAFSKKGYQQSPYRFADDKLEYSNLIKRKNKKRQQIILSCFLVVSIGTLFFSYSPAPIPVQKSSTNKPVVLKNEIQQKKSEKKLKLVKTVSLQARGINLSFISSKLYVVNALVKECRAMCQAHRRIDSSCDKANEIMKEIYSKINLYKEHFRRHDITELQVQDQKMALEINQYLQDIPREMETAKNLCQRPVIQVPEQPTKPVKQTPKRLLARDFGINLDEIIEIQEIKLKFIEKCADSCVRRGRQDVNCVALRRFREKYDNKVKSFWDMVNINGWHKFTQQDQSKFETIRKSAIQFNEHVRISNRCVR